MNELKNALKNEPVVYVARDLERAKVCFEKGYYIITNSSSFAQSSAEMNPNIITIPGPRTLDTHELLTHPETKRFLFSLKNFSILVFKNTSIIENICRKEKWKLLNPPSHLAQKVEEKISQLEWLGDLKKYLPEQTVLTGKELVWNGEPSVVQFNRAHSGTGTMLIDSTEKIKLLNKNFPDRPVRVTKYISGPTFTNNNVVSGNHVLIGPINYQITGLKPFTDNQFTTIGNDWGLASKILSDAQTKAYHEMVETIGKKLSAGGWKGLFGIDAVLDEKTGKIYLIEINARQPASVAFETELQSNASNSGLTSFEAHLTALLNLKSEGEKLTDLNEGAQILYRIGLNSQKVDIKKATGSLQKLGLKVIAYENTEPGQELLRVQSKKGIMSAHNKFNELGEKIRQILE